MAVEPIWTTTLWGLSSRTLDRWLTAATVGLLAASRFFLLARSPWEQDETLFARALMGFDLAAHFPHPPGFPLWLALGSLVEPLAATPLQALQWLSAAASVLTLWPAASLARRVASPRVAAAAALVTLFLPGVWFHAVRGFSSTPAAFLILWSAALAARGLERRVQTTGFTTLLAAAFLVRPVLAPPLAALWLIGAASVRPRRDLLPGMMLAAAMAAAGIAGLAALAGGLPELMAVTEDHGRHHTRDLVWNTMTFANLGLVRGLGGPGAAIPAVLVTAGGLAVWLRRRPTHALAWVAVAGIGMGQLLLLQNPSHPRYAVPLYLALTPVVAAATSLVPAPVAVSALFLASGGAALAAMPAVLIQHFRPSPAYEAAEWARRQALAEGAALVVEPSIYPLLSYAEHLARRRGEPALGAVHLAPTSDDHNVDPLSPPWSARLLELRRWRRDGGPSPAGLLDQLPQENWLLLTDRPWRYLPGRSAPEWLSRPVPGYLRALSQGRFLEAAVLRSPVLPLDGWWEVETESAGQRFRWGRAGAGLWLPAIPVGSAMHLWLRPLPAPAPVRLEVQGEVVATVDGEGGDRVISLPWRLLAPGRPTEVRLYRPEVRPPGGGDYRPLAFQWLGTAVIGPGLPWEGAVAAPAQRALLGIEATGLWGPEHFPGGPGCWTAGAASLRLAGGAGNLAVKLSAPRPDAVTVAFSCQGITVATVGVTGERAITTAVTIPRECVTRDRVDLDLSTFPVLRSGSESRELGVVLHHLRFAPAHQPRMIGDRQGEM